MTSFNLMNPHACDTRHAQIIGNYQASHVARVRANQRVALAIFDVALQNLRPAGVDV